MVDMATIGVSIGPDHALDQSAGPGRHE